MRVNLVWAFVLFAACSDGEQDDSGQEPAANQAPDAGPAHDQGGQVPGSSSAEAQASSTTANDESPPESARAAAFHVLEPLPNELVQEADNPTQIETFIQLFGGGADDLFGFSSVVVTDSAGVRIGSQVFRWSAGVEVVTLDDNTPWKRLHFAADDMRWVVGERGSGLASAQAFVWSEAEGLREIAVGDDLPVLVRGVSADGKVVVGDGQQDGNWRTYRWTSTAGAELIELPAGHISSGSSSVSADGATVYGTISSGVVPAQCFRWEAASGITLLDPVPDADGWAAGGCGVTHKPAADGSATGGTRSYSPTEATSSQARWEAFHWAPQSGQTTILPPDGYGHTQAFETSRDGNVVYGQTWVDNTSTSAAQPFRWTAETGTVALGIPSGSSRAELLAADARNRVGISDDGHTVAGNTVRGEQRGFIWSLSEGLVTLEPLPGHTRTRVTQLAPSGRLAVGLSMGDGVEAVVWDVSGKPQAIRELLTDAGVDIAEFDFGNQFTEDVGLLDEGTRVFGMGTTDSGGPAAWMAILP